MSTYISVYHELETNAGSTWTNENTKWNHDAIRDAIKNTFRWHGSRVDDILHAWRRSGTCARCIRVGTSFIRACRRCVCSSQSNKRLDNSHRWSRRRWLRETKRTYAYSIYTYIRLLIRDIIQSGVSMPMPVHTRSREYSAMQDPPGFPSARVNPADKREELSSLNHFASILQAFWMPNWLVKILNEFH